MGECSNSTAEGWRPGEVWRLAITVAGETEHPLPCPMGGEGFLALVEVKVKESES
jgi:hypothetical protein